MKFQKGNQHGKKSKRGEGQFKKELKEKLKLIQVGVQYIVPRLRQIEEVIDEPPRQFQIEVIDSLTKADGVGTIINLRE